MIDQRLLTSVLASLYFDGQCRVADLRRDLERTHGIVVSAATVRGALLLLDQAGLVRRRDEEAQLTEMGTEVAARRVPMPDLV